MKAMILAAGRGERMRPLTDHTPKPLLEVKGKALILWHIEKLARNGFTDIVINIAHLGEQIIDKLGDGSEWGVHIIYSDERVSGALESAGGIKKALPLLGPHPFLVVNADIFCEYEFDASFTLEKSEAHLILVPNPAHNPQGDFGIEGDILVNSSDLMYTFSGIAYYSPHFFDTIELQKSALAPYLRQSISKKALSGALFKKVWHDIGTPKRLKEINYEKTTPLHTSTP